MTELSISILQIELTEATSSLDNRTEEEVNRSIAELSARNRELTLVVIAHRDSSLEYCDRILNIGE